jgi:hypothetical protein
MQEEIAPPLERAEDYDPDEWCEQKKAYKEQLERAIKAHWGNAVTKIDKRSDLYVYFYYQGLDLLRPGGVFCLINSNSWLDVGYGASLQEFLLRNIAVQQVIDNQARRSFKKSDVNTIIVVLKRPAKDMALKDNEAKFIAYRQPFESAVNAENLLLQEWAKGIESGNEYRIYSITQKELWLDGIEEGKAPSLELGLEHGKYVGGKWGGKYLRAPDIFFTILEKGKGKLVRLGDIAEVRRGFTTGANDFFYLEPTDEPSPNGLIHVKNRAGWEGFLEEEFLKPVVKSPREIKTILIRPQDLRYKVFMCHLSKAELKKQGKPYALEYIRWGELQEYNERPSCRGRPKWWDLGRQLAPKLACNYLVNDLMRFYYAPEGVYFSDDFQEIWAEGTEQLLWAIGNSHLTAFFINLYGRSVFGGGLLKIQTYEVANTLCLNPSLFPKGFPFAPLTRWEIKSVFEELGLPKPNRDYSNILLEDVSLDKVLPDRRELDRVVFEALGLTEEEQLEVYRAVVELVKNRLTKARSV